jgi:hypothetical protein
MHKAYICLLSCIVIWQFCTLGWMFVGLELGTMQNTGAPGLSAFSVQGTYDQLCTYCCTSGTARMAGCRAANEWPRHSQTRVPSSCASCFVVVTWGSGILLAGNTRFS